MLPMRTPNAQGSSREYGVVREATTLLFESLPANPRPFGHGQRASHHRSGARLGDRRTRQPPCEHPVGEVSADGGNQPLNTPGRKTMIANWLLRAGPWPWIAPSVVDRFGLIYLFASRYVSTDDSVMWHAAVDFAHARFHGPYFYGQSYGPMLEALVAAPLVRTGIPLNILMPGVTSLLALLPYWSFALWFHRQGRGLAAMVVAALPVLMPVEFGLMTTMCRGFITGAAVLALLPWASNIADPNRRSLAIGCIVSIAWFVNPNSLIFSVPFLVHYLLTSERGLGRRLVDRSGHGSGTFRAHRRPAVVPGPSGAHRPYVGRPASISHRHA